ncbi:MAG: hypothetical protein IH623_31320, partial [Verrucomicrobia bacterium]|nr:hypothetical protein [Verrucomicrobiota bacterium]
PRLALAPRSPPLAPQIALHPGSGSEKKNWPEPRWSELLTTVAGKTRYDFLLVGGEVEGQRLQRLAARLPPQRVQIAQSLPLSELAKRLQACAAFMGHDSGISHLAAALGLPCLVLWADTIEEIWRPQGERVTVIREICGLHSLSVQRVTEELARVLFRV